ncbi:MAG: tryptophan 2,3-dioxygenase [Robiginitomaculum sp.]|nr:MAG: tryptophan 2,3-dioxygenase [Robiginitomaculum sp.]
MDRQSFYKMMEGKTGLDYELYLKSDDLLACQKPFDELCNKDELQFQIVHQVEELWMKLMAYTLLDIDEYMAEKNANRIITLFGRVDLLQSMMNLQLALLETMSPKEYQQIRLALGNGSGQESPGFRVLIRMGPLLWESFKTHYLDADGKTVESIYDSEYSHCDAYKVAECLAQFDSMFQRFGYRHMQLIARTIGFGAKSLKGRSVDLLQAGIRRQFYPELWAIRDTMTDSWGGEYGQVRGALGKESTVP